MLKKILKVFLIGLAALIALAYAFGYSYLFKAVSKTYLRGETSATIDDGKNFPSHVIEKGQTKIWEKDSLYNKKALPKALKEDLKNTNTRSFLVIKDHKIIQEHYWQNGSEKKQTNSFSMAKAITVLLVQKAIEEKKMKSWHQPFYDYFQNYENVEFGKYLTLRDLATMEAGLNWTENYNNPFLQNAKAYYGKSLEEAVFLRGFKEKPGTKFEYQSGATQLLGFALRKSMNKTVAEYASEKLWKPLGMEQNAEWSTDEFGMEKTFCCIHSNSRDYAKLGQLFLDEGKVGETQIISSEFLEEMKTPTKHSNGVYGMGLWINNDVPIKHYFYSGLYGQFIIIIPEQKMIIVRTGMSKKQPKDTKGRPKHVAFLVEEVSKNF